MVEQSASLLYIWMLGIYVLLMLSFGFFANRTVNSVEDYLVAGRKLPFLLAVPSLVATWYGVGFCMGVSGLVYSDGVPAVLADPFGSTFALLIAGLFFAGRFRKLKLLTVADILGRAFGKRMEVCASVLMLPFYVGTLAAQMVALGYLLHLFAHIDTTTAIATSSLLMMAYTMAGGMWAVSLTDFIQLTVLLVGMCFMLPTVYSELQDPIAWNALKTEVVGLLPSMQSSTPWLVYCGQLLITGVGAVMGQDIIQRCLATRSVRTARASVLVSAVLYFILGWIPILIGFAGRTLIPDLDTSELLFPTLAAKHFTPLLTVVFIGGLILAIMSSADSYLLAGTSILTLNMVLPLFPQQTEQKRLVVLRFCSIALTGCAFLLAIAGFNIFQLVIHSGAMLFVAIFVPVTATLYYRKASAVAAWCSMGVGVTAWAAYLIIGYMLLGVSGDALLYAAATVGGAGSAVGYLVAVMVKRFLKTNRLLPVESLDLV